MVVMARNEFELLEFGRIWAGLGVQSILCAIHNEMMDFFSLEILSNCVVVLRASNSVDVFRWKYVMQ